jgi:hypothetical protein
MAVQGTSVSPSKSSKRLNYLLIALCLGTAALLRLSALDIMEYKKDESDMVQLISTVVDDGVIVTHGQLSSKGPHQSPLATYLLAPAWALSRDPKAVVWWIGLMNVAAVGVTYWIGRRYISPRAGLIAAACHAVSPWAVVFSRKIWLEDLVPLFTGMLMASTLSLVVEGRRRSVFWVCLWAGVLAQVYLAGYLSAAAVVLVLIIYRPRISVGALTLGLATLGLLSAPYVAYLAGGGWRDFFMLLPRGATLGNFTPNLKQIEPLIDLVNQGNFAYLIGNTYPYLNIELGLSAYLVDGLAALERLILIGGFGWLLWRMFFSKGESRSLRPLGLLLTLYMVIPALICLVAPWKAPPHYYITAFPALFLVVGMTAEEGLGRLNSWVGSPIRYRAAVGLVGLALAGIVLTQVYFTTKLFSVIRAKGGASGDYGLSYLNKAALADYLAEAYGPDCFELAYERQPTDTWAVGAEIPGLVLRRADPRPCPKPGPAKLYLLDTLTQPLSPEAESRLKPFERFGPLYLYTEAVGY